MTNTSTLRRSATAALAALAVGAGVLAVAPAASAAEDAGATSWVRGALLETSGATPYPLGESRKSNDASTVSLDLTKTDAAGEPIAGAEFTLEWVSGDSYPGAWIEEDVWETERDRGLEQNRIDLADSWKEVVETEGGGVTPEAAFIAKRDGIGADYREAGLEIVEHLAPYTGTEFTVTTGTDGVAEIDLIGHNMNSAGWAGGHFIVTDEASGETAKVELFGVVNRMYDHTKADMSTEAADVFTDHDSSHTFNSTTGHVFDVDIATTTR